MLFRNQQPTNKEPQQGLTSLAKPSKEQFVPELLIAYQLLVVN